MPPIRILLAGLVCFGLAACSYVPHIVTEYRIDVQQGNVLNQEMVSQLKPGQTRDQVRFILGTPMLTDMFHANRWDYVYRLQNGRTNVVETRRLSVFFDQEGRLEKVTGDTDVAQASELTAPPAKNQVIDLGSLPADGKPLPPPEEKGFFGRMKEKIGF
ncbi:MAG: outer membrane protein assembly factor BamE [Betaproteobacteria bacterium]